MARARLGGGRQEGMSLVEVVFAMVVLSIAMVSAAQMFEVGIVSDRIARRRTLAHAYLQREMESVLARPYAEIASLASAALPYDSSYRVEVAVTTPLANLKQIVVVMRWTGFNGQESSRSVVAYRAKVD